MQVIEDIRRDIASGLYRPGEKIPSEIELGDIYRVSRITVRNAVKVLEREGLLIKRQNMVVLLDTVPAGKWNTGDLMADMHWDHYNVGWNDGAAAAVKSSIFARTSPAWDYTVLFDRKW